MARPSDFDDGMDAREIIARAESLLRDEWGRDVRLQLERTYENPTTIVVRANVTGPAPASIAIKHVGPHHENPTGYLHSFFNDWAACLFLNSFNHNPPLAPRFYSGDTEHHILIMEDLGVGDGPDTMTLLDGNDPDLAAQSLVEHAALIGQLHAATIDRSDDYVKMRERLGPLPPHPDLFSDPWSNARRYSLNPTEINQVIERYRTVRERLGLSPLTGIDAEIEEVSSRVENDPGPFLTYCKGDQNLPADFIRSGQCARLFDYGEAGYRHALLEGMPGRFTWGCMMRIPAQVMGEMETAYRNELVRGCPNVTSDQIFQRAMADAGARWHIFHVLTRVSAALANDYQRGPTTLRQQVVAWIDAFADLSDETRLYGALGRSAREISVKLRTMWSEEETCLPFYPTFT